MTVNIVSEKINLTLSSKSQQICWDFAVERSARYDVIREKMIARGRTPAYSTNDPRRQYHGVKAEYTLGRVLDSVFGEENVAHNYLLDGTDAGRKTVGDLAVYGVPFEIKCLGERQWSDNYTWTDQDGNKQKSLATMIPSSQAWKYRKSDFDTIVVFATYSGNDITLQGWMPVDEYIKTSALVQRPDGKRWTENYCLGKENLYPMNRLQEWMAGF